MADLRNLAVSVEHSGIVFDGFVLPVRLPAAYFSIRRKSSLSQTNVRGIKSVSAVASSDSSAATADITGAVVYLDAKLASAIAYTWRRYINCCEEHRTSDGGAQRRFLLGSVSYLHDITVVSKHRKAIVRRCEFDESSPEPQRVVEKTELHIVFELMESAQLIIMSWCSRVEALVRRAQRLYETLNWLKTVGGGYSCLGYVNRGAAKKAGEIARAEFDVAAEMGDRDIGTQCLLWIALSRMQLGAFKEARRYILLARKRILDWPVYDWRVPIMVCGVEHQLNYYEQESKSRGTKQR